MKKVVVEMDKFSLKYDNVIAVARGMMTLGIDVKMWHPNATSFLDMIHDLKPDLVFHQCEINDRVRSKVDCKLIDTTEFENMVIADVLAFKPMSPSPTFSGAETCVIQYPEVEDTNNLILMRRMSTKHTNPFRIFSDKKMGGAKYVGSIAKEMLPLIFSSASSVLTLSKHTAVNAALCSKAVTLIEDNKETNFKLDDTYLDQVSNVEIARRYATV